MTHPDLPLAAWEVAMKGPSKIPIIVSSSVALAFVLLAVAAFRAEKTLMLASFSFVAGSWVTTFALHIWIYCDLRAAQTRAWRAIEAEICDRGKS